MVNRNDTAIKPELLSSLRGRNIEFALGDAVYDSQQIYKTAEQLDIFFVSPINRRNSSERKGAYGYVIPVLLKTRFEKWLFGLRNAIEWVFNQLKINGLEQPKWYGFQCCLLHVQLCIIMHNF
jgi:hypothetical protein